MKLFLLAAIYGLVVTGSHAFSAELTSRTYTGVPKFEFKAAQMKGQVFDSTAAMAQCKREVQAERAKITKLGYSIVMEEACLHETNSSGSFVAASFHFLGIVTSK